MIMHLLIVFVLLYYKKYNKKTKMNKIIYKKILNRIKNNLNLKNQVLFYRHCFFK
jgi:hypothetical protein